MEDRLRVLSYTVTPGGLGQSRSALGRPVLCGFLASRRKDFPVRVHMILKVHLLRTGQETNEGLGVEEGTGESLGGVLLWLPRKVIGKE